MEFHICHGAQEEEHVFLSIFCLALSEEEPGKVAHSSAPTTGESEGVWIVESKSRTT